jgi:methyltransferase
MTGAEILLALVAAERLAELLIARRNTAALIAAGAREVAPGHYPVIVTLHAVWLAGLWWLARDHPLDYVWLAVFLALQGLRVWTLATLGRRWTTRIIVVPGAALVAKGPYRFIRHPNYLVVVGEIACLPLALGAPIFALVLSLANAAVLAVRIHAENAALAEARP